MFIRSERLFLRPAWPEDWQDVLAAIGDEAIVRNLAKAPWPYSAEDAKAFVNRVQPRGLPSFMITLPSGAGAKLVGSMGLERNGGEVELGYWIARDHWGRGYATEAARSVVGLARALGHRRIVASHFLDNPASGRVLKKVGFTASGDVFRRFSAGRGGDAPALRYALAFACPGDCDDDDASARRMEAA